MKAENILVRVTIAINRPTVISNNALQLDGLSYGQVDRLLKHIESEEEKSCAERVRLILEMTGDDEIVEILGGDWRKL